MRLTVLKSWWRQLRPAPAVIRKEASLKTKFKHIYMECVGDTGKTTRWEIKHNQSNVFLGMIYWYSPWRQYVSETKAGVIFSEGCHRDVADFIRELASNRITGKGRAGKTPQICPECESDTFINRYGNTECCGCGKLW